MSTAPPFERIEAVRRRLGPALTIMAHHYQSDAVIRHADISGDSLELARRVTEVDSEHIVFCGVYFMAESAALLSRPGQTIFLPDHTAECSMALMAEAPAAERVLRALNGAGRKVVPLAYVNSTVSVKGVVGAYGGSVCTSSNAEKMLRWAFDQGDAVLFLPDQNLGMNIAGRLGIAPLEQKVLDAQGQGEHFDPSGTDHCRLLLWPGYCSIHTFFTTEHVATARKAHPDATVIVHPECTPDVVAAVDAAGSTAWMIRYAAEAPAGSTLIIGTEANLVHRLARRHAGRITVLPLAESLCEFMAQITEERLAETLDSVAAGKETFKVAAPDQYKANAALALERMLRVS